MDALRKELLARGLAGAGPGPGRAFLRVRPGGLAGSYPAPAGGLPYDVRDLGGGEYVGVCPETGATLP